MSKISKLWQKYDDMHYRDLQKEAKSNSLPAKGKKEDLIQRLIEWNLQTDENNPEGVENSLAEQTEHESPKNTSLRSFLDRTSLFTTNDVDLEREDDDSINQNKPLVSRSSLFTSNDDRDFEDKSRENSVEQIRTSKESILSLGKDEWKPILDATENSAEVTTLDSTFTLTRDQSTISLSYCCTPRPEVQGSYQNEASLAENELEIVDDEAEEDLLNNDQSTGLPALFHSTPESNNDQEDDREKFIAPELETSDRNVFTYETKSTDSCPKVTFEYDSVEIQKFESPLVLYQKTPYKTSKERRISQTNEGDEILVPCSAYNFRSPGSEDFNFSSNVNDSIPFKAPITPTKTSGIIQKAHSTNKPKLDAKQKTMSTTSLKSFQHLAAVRRNFNFNDDVDQASEQGSARSSRSSSRNRDYTPYSGRFTYFDTTKLSNQQFFQYRSQQSAKKEKERIHH